MTSGFYGPEDSGSSPFDDFLARIYGSGGPRQPVHRVDITRLMSAPARELLSLAATHAAEQGGRDLDTEQLLWGAASMEPTRTLLARAGADPDELVGEIESQEAGAGPSGEPPQLTPGAKRALLDAHQISRVVGSTYIGPEHILFALAANPESGPGHPRNPAAGPDRAGRRGGRPQRSGGPRRPVGHADAGRIRPRSDRPGPGRPDRPGHRARRRD
jgi:ATP-dependent Clp protease ATP-binding subunit ClpC